MLNILCCNLIDLIFIILFKYLDYLVYYMLLFLLLYNKNNMLKISVQSLHKEFKYLI